MSIKPLTYCFIVFTVLSCTKKSTPPPELTPLTMAPSTWVLYLYKDNTMQNPISRNDTLIFTTKDSYTYNHIKNNYALNPSQNNFELSLQNTAFGNLSGTIQTNFEQGEIINAPFYPITPNGQVFSLWLKKIE